MAAPTKAEQVSEAEARQASGIDPGETAAATATIDDVAGDAPPAPAAKTDAVAEPAPLPPARSPFTDKRDAIINRFREQRTEQNAEDTDEISDFVRSGVPADFQTEDAPAADADPAAAAEPEPAAAPAPAAEQKKTVKVKVNGVERELSLEEVIAQAQIALASDGLLDTAKSRLKQVDDLLQTTRAKVTRADQPGENQPGEKGEQKAEPATTDGQILENHEDSIGKLIETLQFGDPAEARMLLEKTIRETSRQETQQQLGDDRLRDEGARTAKVLKDFEGKHPDLAADQGARAVIETFVCKAQTDDLTALGVDLTKLRTRIPGVVSADDIAFAHRWYRANGFTVTAPDKLLETATTDFLKWKGGGAEQQLEPADPAPGAKPQVEVTVDRSARRAALTPQPSRTATPKPDATRQAAQPRDRSSVVQQMAARRAAPRGKVAIG